MTEEITYKNCRIKPSLLELRGVNEWRPRALVTWSEGASDYENLVTHDKTYATQAEAVEVALSIGKTWVDHKFD